MWNDATTTCAFHKSCWMKLLLVMQRLAQRRMAVIDTLPLLDLTFEVDGLAETIMQSGLLPVSASRDAVHIAVTAVHRVHFLLTWNCRHIANATIFRDLQHVIMSAGYDMPVICTPEELLGD